MPNEQSRNLKTEQKSNYKNSRARKNLIKYLSNILATYGNSYCLDAEWERQRVAALMADAFISIFYPQHPNNHQT